MNIVLGKISKIAFKVSGNNMYELHLIVNPH